MIYHDCLIIGGGASGIMAALVAKDLGKDVAIIEGTDRIGKKILTTGMDDVIFLILISLHHLLIIIVKITTFLITV